MAYISPTEALTRFLSAQWKDTPVCYPNMPEPELDDHKHWLQVWAFQSTSQTSLDSSKRVLDQGLFYIDVVGEAGSGTGKFTKLASKLTKMLQCQQVNGVSLQGARISPAQGYNSDGRYVVRVMVEYIVDYEF